MTLEEVQRKYANMCLLEAHETTKQLLDSIHNLETDISSLKTEFSALDAFITVYNEDIVPRSQALIIEHQKLSQLLLTQTALSFPEAQFRQVKALLPGFPNLASFLTLDQCLNAAFVQLFLQFFPAPVGAETVHNSTFHSILTEYLKNVFSQPIQTPELARVTKAFQPQRFRIGANGRLQSVPCSVHAGSACELLTEIYQFLISANQMLLQEFGDNDELFVVFSRYQQDFQHSFYRAVIAERKRAKVAGLVGVMRDAKNFISSLHKIEFEEVSDFRALALSCLQKLPDFIKQLIQSQVTDLLNIQGQTFAQQAGAFISYIVSIIETEFESGLKELQFSEICSEQLIFSLQELESSHDAFTRIFIEKIPKSTKVMEQAATVDQILRVYLMLKEGAKAGSLLCILTKSINNLVQLSVLQRAELYGHRFKSIKEMQQGDRSDFMSIFSEKFQRQIREIFQRFKNFVEIDVEFENDVYSLFEQ
ncbi:hypothetical protein SS50377_27940 [Spironucleus salmonicida]|uniref:Uncharacterized protein n=1 Tax=Spironucleus salmonicida TaxID=348837 RepID=V6LDE4_9EUKA|nr:hypothetical protein SS50377_27940 [Spironucleus salmonicida]|eukprot:EST42502.1 Hypothetical protein SS50377_17808 [Spironucleus salmonicida]